MHRYWDKKMCDRRWFDQHVPHQEMMFLPLLGMAPSLISGALAAALIVTGYYHDYQTAMTIHSLLTMNPANIGNSIASGIGTGAEAAGAWLASSAAGGLAQAGVLAAGTASFVSLYGGDMYSKLTTTMHDGL
jgi:hypothetical protein